MLCIAAADSISSSNEATVVAASAIEMMHVYSLIHDDLPSMDNDDLRRGIASCHIKYNDNSDTCRDALQALAFETLSNIKSLSYENHLKIIKILSNNIGCSGMVKGQALDLDTTYKPSSREELDEMHRCKTGALIEASVLIGAITTQEMTDSQEFALKNFAQKIGLAFQIKDDVLDVESSTEAMGKLKGSDDITKSAHTLPFSDLINQKILHQNFIVRVLSLLVVLTKERRTQRARKIYNISCVNYF